MTSFKMLFSAVDKINILRNVNMSYYDYIFSFLLYFFWIFALCTFASLLLYLMVYDVYLLRELYLLSLKVSIFASLKIKI